jgi:NAD(P)-dependent dehydrogenase (short-subunit alcohol dehydrogenase family)
MNNSNQGRSVLITGASTGIGRACALYLDALGWQVFAGVRRSRDAASLHREASDRLIAISLDVTDSRSIRNALKRVRDTVGKSGLAGLVNNAGIPYGGPVEFLALKKVRGLFEVNFFGVIAVTQAFLPLLRLGHGRVVNMSSVGGMVSAPFVSPYSSSKFALEALTDSLRMELRPWHIQVSSVQPGAIDTPIWGKGGSVLNELIHSAPTDGLDLYGGAIRGMQPRFQPHGIPTNAVSQAVAHALASPHPKTRYRIGFEGALVHVVSKLPDRLRDWLILSQLPHWG